MQSGLTPTIGLQIGVEVATGRDWRTGKKESPQDMAIRSIAPLGMGQRIASGDVSPKNSALSMVGISSPKSTIGDTPAEVAINRSYYDSLPQNEKTPAALKKAQLKSNLRAEKEQDNSKFQEHLDEAMDKGEISAKEYQDFQMPDKQTLLQKRFSTLNNVKQGNILLKASKDEFDDLYPIYMTKYADTFGKKSEEEQAEMDSIKDKVEAKDNELFTPKKKTKLDELLERLGIKVAA